MKTEKYTIKEIESKLDELRITNVEDAISLSDDVLNQLKEQLTEFKEIVKSKLVFNLKYDVDYLLDILERIDIIDIFVNSAIKFHGRMKRNDDWEFDPRKVAQRHQQVSEEDAMEDFLSAFAKVCEEWEEEIANV